MPLTGKRADLARHILVQSRRERVLAELAEMAQKPELMANIFGKDKAKKMLNDRLKIVRSWALAAPDDASPMPAALTKRTPPWQTN